MQQFISFVKKEFRHILRDRRTLLILFGMPVAQILIFGFALSNEVKNARIAVLDLAKDADSQRLTAQLEASRYFDIFENIESVGEVDGLFRKGNIKMAVVFPTGFGESLRKEGGAAVQLIADASDPNTATTLVNYASAILFDYSASLNPGIAPPLAIRIEPRILYNPQLKGEYNFVPGVMTMVLMLISAMMTAVAIVREKELGTMEILLVSPMKPLMVILSKMVPYLTLSLINFSTILLLSVFVLGVPVRGNILLLAAEGFLYITCSLALGLLISTRTSSQQVAMMASMMGLMMPTILFSGFMFPLENLPEAMQWIAHIVPAKWFFIIVKNIMLKGLGFGSVWVETLILLGMTVFFIMVSVRSFKIRLE